MGKIVSNFFMSLDGVVESPDQWHFPYFNDEMGATIGRGADTYKAFLMGRVLYEQWAAYWPSQGDEVPFAPFINNVPKYVVSNTLDEAKWNNSTVVAGDVAAQLRQIKDRTDGDIGMSGSATPRWSGGSSRTGSWTNWGSWFIRSSSGTANDSSRTRQPTHYNSCTTRCSKQEY